MRDWDLRKFQVLRELQRQGTVTAAAWALSLTPSAVSQALTGLAKQAGGPVIEPDGRRVRLTELAHVLLRHGEAVFAQLEEAEADIAAHLRGDAGLVRIGSFATGVGPLVMPAVAALGTAHPGLTVQVREAEAADVYDQLERGDVDVALSLAVQAPTGSDRRFTHFPLLADPLDAALPATHPLATATDPQLSLADLAGEPWVYGADGPWREITLAVCANAGFTPRAAHTASDWDAILSIVEAGLAVALVPRLVDARRSRRGGIAVRVLAADQPRRHVVGAVRRGSEGSPRLREVVRALQQVAAERESIQFD